MKTRPATAADAAAMSRVLEEIVADTGRARKTDPDHVRALYVENPDSILCSVAMDDTGDILGFQSLIHAREGNAYGVEPGWGIIGTHVSPRAARRGAGSLLFAASRAAAREAGLSSIDATIGAENAVALGYYDAMGFRTYREAPGAICKRYDLV